MFWISTDEKPDHHADLNRCLREPCICRMLWLLPLLAVIFTLILGNSACQEEDSAMQGQKEAQPFERPIEILPWEPGEKTILLYTIRDGMVHVALADTTLDSLHVFMRTQEFFRGAISLDGRYVAVCEFSEGRRKLIIIDRLQQVQWSPVQSEPLTPTSWTADDKLLLTRNISEGSIEIVRIDPFYFTGIETVVDHAGEMDYEPAADPVNPNRIAYVYNAYNWTFYGEIRIRYLDTKEDYVLLPSDGNENRMPSFSPNGDYLLFISQAPQVNKARIIVMNIITGKKKIVSERATSVLPYGRFVNGEEVIFVTHDQQNSHFHRFDLHTGKSRPLTSFPGKLIIEDIQ